MANECVPYYMPGAHVTGRCTAAVTGKRFLAVDTTQTGANAFAPEGLKSSTSLVGQLVPVKHCGAGARALGVSQRDKANGEPIGVIMEGVVPVTSGAAVTPGQEVESDANGKAIPLNTGKAIGLALSHATATDQTLAVKLYS